MKMRSVWCLFAVLLSGCRMPDMFSVSPYYGDMVMERSNGLDHHEWGLGVALTWDLNPGRYHRPLKDAPQGPAIEPWPMIWPPGAGDE